MDAQSPDTEILELRSRIEATYAAEPARARLYAFYNRIEEVLSRGKAKEICGSRYSRDLCQCCEFGDGEQDSMFTGILPWEMSWLKTKKSAFKTEDKFAIHDTGLGLVCTACEAACQMKPVDCAMYPYAFANYTGFTVDIMFSGKCSMEGDPAAKEAHIGHQSPNLADLVELMVESQIFHLIF